jgi:CRP-like cAMP-binding protein
MSKQISISELRNLRAAFSRVERFFRDGVQETDAEGVKETFGYLSIDCSDRLVEALMTDCPLHSENRFDLADVVQMYISLKKIEFIKLPSSKTWSQSSIISGALETKYFLADSFPRTIWNLYVLALAMLQWWVVFYRDGWEGLYRETNITFVVIDLFCSGMTALDIFLWSRTVVADRGRMHTIDYLPRIRAHYRSTWMIPDIISAVPIDVMLSLGSSSSDGASIAAGVFSHVRLIRSLRCLTFWSVSGHIPKSVWYVWFHSTLLPLVKLMCLFIMALQFFTVWFMRIKIDQKDLSDLGSTPYIGAMYFIIQTFTTVGYGDVPLNGVQELWFAIVIVFLGLLMNGLLIGKLVAMLQLDSAESRRGDKLRETLAVLQFFDIPKQLQSEILNFQEHVLWSKADTAYGDFINPLPPTMIENIDLVRRISIIASEPLFAEQSEAVMVQLAKSLVSRTSKPEEYVTCSSDTHQGVRWLLFGYVDQLDSHGRYITTLKTGDCFGFEGLLECREEIYNYKALSYCDLLVCPADEFHKVMKNFSTFEHHVRQVLQERLGSADGSGAEHKEGELSRKASIREQQGKPRIVAIRNLHTKLRLYRERLQKYRDEVLLRDAEANVNN